MPTPDPMKHASNIHSYLVELMDLYDQDPDKVVELNKQDLETENRAKLLSAYAQDSSIADHLEELQLVAEIYYWCSLTFTLAYGFHKSIADELKKVPTAEGEKRIEALRKDLADMQDTFTLSPVYRVALTYGGLQGEPRIGQVDLRVAPATMISKLADN